MRRPARLFPIKQEADTEHMTKELPQVLKDKLSAYSNDLRFWLNGKEIKIHNPKPTTLLVNFLHESGLTGTKVGCEQGMRCLHRHD